MGELEYRNLDSTKTFSKLTAAPPPEPLGAVLTKSRIEASELEIGAGLVYNYAAKWVDESVLGLLYELAEEQQLVEKFRALAGGAIMNTGEQRMVLHHLLRGELVGPVESGGKNLGEFYATQQSRIREFSDAVHAGRIVGSSGKRFETVVQIGIGGSDLGPRALYLALEGAVRGRGDTPPMEARFISNVDPDDAASVLAEIDVETTLFVLVSKSGTTQETLTNEALVRDAISVHPGLDAAKHMIAVTSESSPLASSDRYLDCFYIDDYIGGRYSGTSAVGGAVLSLAFGAGVFEEVLSGAHEADRHAFLDAPEGNAAMLDALIGVYERNVRGCTTTAVLPYSQALIRFPAHLQQLDMESNGKSVNRFAEPVAYATGPVILGEPGTNGQHSFYQLLHQGTDIVPLQFVGFRSPQRGVDVEFDGSTSQTKLNANLAAQIVAFAAGKDHENPNKRFSGNRPSSLIHGDALTPKALGALLAHFENKVMFQGFLWNVNSFDQEGVQLGKVLTKQVLADDDVPEALASYATILGV
jgi:glucose-6-phosphate isomerase